MNYPTPLDARLRNLTYETELFADVRFSVYRIKDDKTEELERTEL